MEGHPFDIGIEVSPEPSAFDELSLARLGTVADGFTSPSGRGARADDLQTIYGNSSLGGGGGGGVGGTETSSMRDSQSDFDVTVKCIVQCSQLFGEGVSFFFLCAVSLLIVLKVKRYEASRL